MHPELDRRQHCNRDADHDVDRHRAGGSLEAQDPGRHQHPQSDDEVQPLLPDRECRKGCDCEHGDHDAGDIGVLRDLSGVEAEYPGRKEQECAEDQVGDVAPFCVRPIIHDTLRNHTFREKVSCTINGLIAAPVPRPVMKF